VAQKPVSIVLVGGGHAHAVALASGLRAEPEAGIGLVLVARDLAAPYSGMVPGVISEQYRPEDAHVDMLRLARAAGATVIHGSASGIDRERRQLLLADRPPLPYDILSVDVGIQPDTSAIAGADRATTVKPIAGLIEKVRRLVGASWEKGRIAVVGGGAAGVELAFALHKRFENARVVIVLVTRDDILPGQPNGMREAVRARLAERGIELVTGFPVARIDAEGLESTDGRRIAADDVLLNTEAAAPVWFQGSGLDLDARGFMAVGPTLQSTNDPAVFASGDCAAMVSTPRPKAGVFAVRQGPILAHNLAAAAYRLQGNGPKLRAYRPQRQALAILSTADGRAIAARGPFWAEGAWVWRWKDRLDTGFMRQMASVGAKAFPAPADPVHRAIPALAFDRPDPWPGDIAISEAGGEVVATSLVALGQFIDDHHLWARIAALTALGPLQAAGVTPNSLSVALSLGGLPQRQAEAAFAAAEAGIQLALKPHGVTLGALVIAAGSEPSITLTATGRARPEFLMSLAGAKPNDVILVTRPIGSGLAFAADRLGLLAALDWIELQRQGRWPNGDAARILRQAGASACAHIGATGLGGALSALSAHSQVAASIRLGHLETVKGLPLLGDSLCEQLVGGNRSLGQRVVGSHRLSAWESALLFAPEIVGGLVAAVPPEEWKQAYSELVDAGQRAFIAGRFVERMPGLEGALLVSD
jgi:selenide,water dikinase